MENATKVYKIIRPLIDELRQLVAGAIAKTPPPSLIATLGFTFAGPSPDLTGPSPGFITGTPPITTTGATKVIISVSAKYEAASDAITHTVTQVIQDTHGNVFDTIEFPLPEGDSRVVTRVVEVALPAADDNMLNIELLAGIEARTAPVVTVSDVSFVLMAVAV
jgi:hypothetical protein